MKLYFTNGQIPELAGLTAAQCDAVRCRALVMFYTEHPCFCWLDCLSIIGAGVGATVGGSSALVIFDCNFGWSFALFCGLGSLMGGSIGAFIGRQLLIARMRPYCRRFLEKHRAGAGSGVETRAAVTVAELEVLSSPSSPGIS